MNISVTTVRNLTYNITIIHQISNLEERKKKEMYYINLLTTKVSFGLNVIKK